MGPKKKPEIEIHKEVHDENHLEPHEKPHNETYCREWIAKNSTNPCSMNNNGETPDDSASNATSLVPSSIKSESDFLDISSASNQQVPGVKERCTSVLETVSHNVERPSKKTS